MNFYLTKIKDYLFINYLNLIIIILEITLVCINIFVVYKISEAKELPQQIVTNEEVEEKDEIKDEIIVKKIMVDVKGAIKHPGVYEVEEQAIVNDVIKLAGGLTSSAQTNTINLSKKITDEMVIYVPKKNELTSNAVIKNDAQIIPDSSTIPQSTTQNDNQETAKVSLNNATITQLSTLPGIGEAKAQAIVDYRNNNGEFKTIDDLKNVTGIGDSIFVKVKDYITI